jgi:hypothetical protein
MKKTRQFVIILMKIMKYLNLTHFTVKLMIFNRDPQKIINKILKRQRLQSLAIIEQLKQIRAHKQLLSQRQIKLRKNFSECVMPTAKKNACSK